MAEVTLRIGGRAYPIACRDGEEDRVRLLGEMVQARWPAADRAAGGLSAERAMLFVALMLADDLDEAQASARADGGTGTSDAALARIAERLEKLADTLEQAPSNA